MEEENILSQIEWGQIYSSSPAQYTSPSYVKAKF